MDQFDPIDVEEKGDAAIAAPAGTTGVSGVSAAGATARGPEQARGEQMIPVAKEELDVGKRQTERRYRVRTHIVERPVEEQVHLRDERVTIERRPASRAAGDSDLRDRDDEIVERHEEPVVAKKAGAAEEVVVRKEASDRVETVRDKVRETKVDIDRAAAGEKPGIGSGADPVRTPKIPD
jgi:stress response protein YsnF